MTALKIVLLCINILSLVGIVVFLPFGIYEFFAGRQSAENFLAKTKIPLSYTSVEVLFLVSLSVAFVTYLLLNQIK